MSRIAGLLGAGAPADAKPLLDFMAADAKAFVQPAGEGQLGWCGDAGGGAFSGNGVVVVLDGIFYNPEDLGKEKTDAARLAGLYRAHGFEGALTRINGDFAAALFDEKDGSLWLGRDRFGLRPLYYALPEGRLAFASRPGSLLKIPGVSPEVDRRFVAVFAASHYRYFDNRPETSPYRDIRQLPAGHTLRFVNGNAATSRYWTLEERDEFTLSEEELAERYRGLMVDAVHRRVRTARNPIFTLSGGMDSSSVLASAVHATGTRFQAISTVYKDETYDETPEIRSMLETVAGKWHAVPIGNPDVPTLVTRMIAAHDEPVATATWLSHFVLCEQARQRGFDSLFGGLGGDELNAGEYEYFFFFFADLRAQGLEKELKAETEKWIEYHDHPVFKKTFKVMEDAMKMQVDLARPGLCRLNPVRFRRYFPALNPEYFDLDGFDPVMDHPFRSYLKNRTWQDMSRETLPCCLRAEDRQTVRFGLGNYLPFLDHRLVEFMFRVPVRMKIRNGITKHLLRRAMKGILPEETRTRIKKTGWNAPAHVWFSGTGKEMVLDLVRSRSFRERGVYDPTEVTRLIEDHDRIMSSGALVENHMMFLWQLVNLELWFRGMDRDA